MPLHNETAYAARAIRLDGSKNDDIYISISCQENIKITYPVEVMLLY